jgi:hypothetical protein
MFAQTVDQFQQVFHAAVGARRSRPRAVSFGFTSPGSFHRGRPRRFADRQRRGQLDLPRTFLAAAKHVEKRGDRHLSQSPQICFDSADAGFDEIRQPLPFIGQGQDRNVPGHLQAAVVQHSKGLAGVGLVVQQQCGGASGTGDRTFHQVLQRADDIPARARRKTGLGQPSQTAPKFEWGDIRYGVSAEDMAERHRPGLKFSFLWDHTGRSPVQAALRFVLDQPGVTAVVPGMKTIEQLEDNAAAGCLSPLTCLELERCAPV